MMTQRLLDSDSRKISRDCVSLCGRLVKFWRVSIKAALGKIHEFRTKIVILMYFVNNGCAAGYDIGYYHFNEVLSHGGSKGGY